MINTALSLDEIVLSAPSVSLDRRENESRDSARSNEFHQFIDNDNQKKTAELGVKERKNASDRFLLPSWTAFWVQTLIQLPTRSVGIDPHVLLAGRSMNETTITARITNWGSHLKSVCRNESRHQSSHFELDRLSIPARSNQTIHEHNPIHQNDFRRWAKTLRPVTDGTHTHKKSPKRANN